MLGTPSTLLTFSSLCRMGGKAQGLRKGATASLFPQSSSAGSFDANPSVRFGNAVATTPEEFGELFGHYGRCA